MSIMGWVGSGEDFCGLGWVQKFWVGLGFEKVTHDQLWGTYRGSATFTSVHCPRVAEVCRVVHRFATRRHEVVCTKNGSSLLYSVRD